MRLLLPDQPPDSAPGFAPTLRTVRPPRRAGRAGCVALAPALARRCWHSGGAALCARDPALPGFIQGQAWRKDLRFGGCGEQTPQGWRSGR